MTAHVLALPAVRVLAAGDSDFGAGFIAFAVVLALCVASFFLFRSMNRHLRKVPEKFEQPTRDEE
ncbi:MAG TPA: hypothetical protein VG899_02365 [Mycobacteriales bacterium]|nr:hypothetical protein [Mycobacteriales bacterium]